MEKFKIDTNTPAKLIVGDLEYDVIVRSVARQEEVHNIYRYPADSRPYIVAKEVISQNVFECATEPECRRE